MSINISLDMATEKAMKIINNWQGEWPEDDWIGISENWDLNLYSYEDEDSERAATLYPVRNGIILTKEEFAVDLALPKDISFLNQYDACQLECDGLTRIIHKVLTRRGIDHDVLLGTVTTPAGSFCPHFWIVLPDSRVIDYRLRMWFPDTPDLPHGIFDAGKHKDVVYDGASVDIGLVSDAVFDILTQKV